MLSLDHLVMTAPDLEAGTAWAEDRLGVSFQPGGQHAQFGTHNRLLGLEDGLYLEVIAPDPSAPDPGRARWYDLDASAEPRLSHWACRCGSLAGALAVSPEGAGEPVSVTRGDLSWQMAVPGSGRLPFDDLFPALMAWEGTAHPADRLAQSGLRLSRLTVTHPDAKGLSAAVLPLLSDARVAILPGAPGLSAQFEGPRGAFRL